MSEDKDYTKYSFRITFLVIAIMLVVSLIPPFSVGGVDFRRANILSDVITFRDDTQEREGDLTDLDKQFIEEADRWDELDAAQDDAHAGGKGAEHAPSLEHNWDVGTGDGGGREVAPDAGLVAEIDGQKLVKFDDYTPEGGFSVADFSLMMEHASRERVVRVAFLGDSYIEGDIITADVREQLQELYGGEGVGFVPFGNPLAISRPTVKHTFEGWHNYNLIYKKKAPEEYQNKFFVSGTVSVPEAPTAWSHYKGVGFRKHLSSWSRARLIFINEGEGTVEVAVNDSIRKEFRPEPSGMVQQINLAGTGMKSLHVDVAVPQGFVGYGVVLEGARGIGVDNYAIRSNSGLAMFGTDKQVNTQIGKMLGYDLVVLQWGLNAMDPSVTNYKAYGQQLRRVINYVKACFPRSAIIVMGVGDRATQVEGEFVTMEAVHSMIKVQKAAAEECGVAFWNTFEAMGGQNSMAAFVEKNWAAKDYTHLSYGGGRHIATKFVQALRAAKNDKTTGTGEFAGEERVADEAVVLDLTTATDEPEPAADSVPNMDEPSHESVPIGNERRDGDTVKVLRQGGETVNPLKQGGDTVKGVRQANTGGATVTEEGKTGEEQGVAGSGRRSEVGSGEEQEQERAQGREGRESRRERRRRNN